MGGSAAAARELPNGHRPLSVLDARTKRLDTARQVRQVVGGPDVPVTYLTFGDWTYFIGNPTTCRYPSPLFLQRTAQTRRQVGTPSYQENLDCLSASGSRWLIWDPSWFSLKRTPPGVQAIITREWDCSAPKRSASYDSAPDAADQGCGIRRIRNQLHGRVRPGCLNPIQRPKVAIAATGSRVEVTPPCGVDRGSRASSPPHT